MSTRTTQAVDRLARLLAGGRRHAVGPTPPGPPDTASLDRATLLRTAATGALALSLGVLPRGAHAAGTVTEACRGGSLAACNASGWKTTQASIAFCDRLLGRPGGEAASYECYVDAMSARLAGMKDCRSKCPRKKKQPKAPASPAPGDGGDGGAGQPPASGPPPGCGAVDCVGGDRCCPVQGGGQICCAIGCARSGDGCCSSSSDC